MRRIRNLAGIAAVALITATLASAGHASGATVVDDTKVSDRLHELTVETDAFAEPTKLHVFLPSGYAADSSRNWPVTYILAGMQNNYDSFADFLDGERLSADYPSIIVSPDGNSGFWSDWYNAGRGGPPEYETFVIDQLADLIDDRYRTIPDRSHRAIFGISMGGYGAMMLAARHPDLFGSAATLSGAVDTNNPLIAGALSLGSSLDGSAVDAINGPRLTEAVRWHGRNPTDLASNLRGTNLQVRTANGVLNPAIGEGDDPADAVSCVVEGGVYQGSVSFNRRLDELGIGHLWKDYGNGCHTPENFTREVLDTLAVFKRNFANPEAAPAGFNYRTIEPKFEIWGWQITADPRRALEFMTVEAGKDAFKLAGSGTTTVTSPARYSGLKAVDVGGRKLKPDREGRVTFEVDLGAPHTIQQYRPGASGDFGSATVRLKPHAVVKITKLTRKKRRVRVCAKAIGGTLPKARVRVGKRRVVVRLTQRVRCLTLGIRGNPRRVVISGRDTYGHLVKVSARFRSKHPISTSGPAGLAFYKPPRKLPNGHGKLIWSRRTAPSKAVPGVRSTRRVLYTSTTPQGKKTAVSGYVSVPRGKAPRGGWPVITWAHGTTGIADTCAPSRSLGHGPPEPFIRTWVAAGYAVASTDYQGLGTPGVHPYLVGSAAGRSVLDIVRAARQLDPSIGRRFIITGVSQGGQAALFAASLAGSWTPDLRLRGAISYAPGSHLLEQKNLLPSLTSPSSLSAVAALILAGAVTTSPSLEPAEILTGPALSLYPQINRKCLASLSLPDSFGGLAPSTLIRPGADTAALDKALRAMNPAVRIDGPVMLAQGSADTTAFPVYTELLRSELEAKGDRIDYRLYPGIDHLGIVDAAEADAMAFFKRRLPSG